MAPKAKKAAELVAVLPKVAKPAKDFELKAGKVSMPKASLIKWKKAHDASPAADREPRAVDLLALAIRFQREGGEAAIDAIAQLYLLSADLIGQKNTKATFSAAGLGWGPKAAKTKPAAAAAKAKSR